MYTYNTGCSTIFKIICNSAKLSSLLISYQRPASDKASSYSLFIASQSAVNLAFPIELPDLTFAQECLVFGRQKTPRKSLTRGLPALKEIWTSLQRRWIYLVYIWPSGQVFVILDDIFGIWDSVFGICDGICNGVFGIFGGIY